MATPLSDQQAQQQQQFPTPEVQPSPVGGKGAAQSSEDMDPKMKSKLEAYVTSLMHIMHNPKTASSVQEILKSAPPEQSIPTATLQLTDQVEQSFSKKGPVEPEIKIAGAFYTVMDLAEIGNTGQFWEQPIDGKGVQTLLHGTLTKYIHRGLKTGDIDPVELQMQAEGLLNDKQKEIGGKIQKEAGLPPEPTANMGMERYAKDKAAPLEEENAKLKQQMDQQQNLMLSQAQQKQQEQ